MNDTHGQQDPLQDVPWYFPTTRMTLADGTVMLKAGKPYQRGTAGKVAKAFGVSSRTLGRLAESGHIRAAKVTPQIVLYYPGEIESFIRTVEENPDYWDAKRRREYSLVWKKKEGKSNES